MIFKWVGFGPQSPLLDLRLLHQLLLVEVLPGHRYIFDIVDWVLHVYMYETFMNRLMNPNLLVSNSEAFKGSDFGLVYF